MTDARGARLPAPASRPGLLHNTIPACRRGAPSLPRPPLPGVCPRSRKRPPTSLPGHTIQTPVQRNHRSHTTGAYHPHTAAHQATTTLSSYSPTKPASQDEESGLTCGLEGVRTLDLLFRRQTLYPLSYEPRITHPTTSAKHLPRHATPLLYTTPAPRATRQPSHGIRPKASDLPRPATTLRRCTSPPASGRRDLRMRYAKGHRGSGGLDGWAM